MAELMGTVENDLPVSESVHGSLKRYIILTEARRKQGNKDNILLEWREKDAVIQAWFPRNCVIYLSRLCEKGWSYAVDRYCFHKMFTRSLVLTN
jgi:hypothetical protein